MLYYGLFLQSLIILLLTLPHIVRLTMKKPSVNYMLNSQSALTMQFSTLLFIIYALSVGAKSIISFTPARNVIGNTQYTYQY